MSGTSTLLIAVPQRSIFVGLNVETMFADALTAEARINAGSNVDAERNRYHLICNRIAFAARGAVFTKQAKFVTLGSEYLDILSSMLESELDKCLSARISLSFVVYNDLAAHIKGFKECAEKLKYSKNSVVKARVKFLEDALEVGSHIVEVSSLNHKQESLIEIPNLIPKRIEPRFEKRSDTMDKPVSISQEDSHKRLRNLIKQTLVETHEGRKTSIGFHFEHDVITEILREYVFARKPSRNWPTSLQVVYDDGSSAPDFPLYCLKERKEKELLHLQSLPLMRIGMLSQRHPEMDDIIHMYWFRNQLVSTGKPLGEIDGYCYEESKRLFAIMRNTGVYRIGFFQTGYQPAVVGFFRALVEELVLRSGSKPTLEVIPFYRLKEGYIQAAPWH